MDRVQDIGALLWSWFGPDRTVAQSYWARQLSPGWPPAFHAHLSVTTPETVLIPVVYLQAVGCLLGLAILCLIGVTLSLTGKRKKRTRP